MKDITRRGFIKKIGAAGVGAVYALRVRPLRAQEDEYGGFGMGVQSYCFRKFSLDDALAKTRELGLHFIEIYPGHLRKDLPAQELEKTKAGLKSLDIKVNAYGVCGFGPNEAANRKLFEFGKEMGIWALSANPQKNCFDCLEKLVKEFDIKIAIHNHGPKALYATDEDILTVVEGRDERIGACVDTGHFIRAGVDPVKAIRRLGKRVHGVHLKDVVQGRGDVILGKGGLDVVGALQALKDAGFSGFLSLEYEGDPDNPIPPMAECLNVVKEAVKKLK